MSKYLPNFGAKLKQPHLPQTRLPWRDIDEYLSMHGNYYNANNDYFLCKLDDIKIIDQNINHNIVNIVDHNIDINIDHNNNDTINH